MVNGIIAEYNPFHNGHAYHIGGCGGGDVVALMSGNFTQRGEPSIFDKWERARLAVLCGVDLVLELPVIYVQAAGWFAKGAVKLFAALNIIDRLVFGAECADINTLRGAAEELRRCDSDVPLYMQGGRGYAAARDMALPRDVAELLRTPNNILAVQYVLALDAFGKNIIPHAVQRCGAAHDGDGDGGGICSASRLRRILSQDPEQAARFMPPAAYEYMSRLIAEGKGPVTAEGLEQAILIKLRTSNAESLSALPDVSEGLEHRILTAARRSSCLDELYHNIKSKRYALSRVRRIIMNFAIGITKEDLNLPPMYARVLAFNANGRRLLRRMAECSSIPIVTNPAKHKELMDCRSMLLDIAASDVYSALYPNKGLRYGGMDYRRPPHSLL